MKKKDGSAYGKPCPSCGKTIDYRSNHCWDCTWKHQGPTCSECGGPMAHHHQSRCWDCHVARIGVSTRTCAQCSTTLPRYGSSHLCLDCHRAQVAAQAKTWRCVVCAAVVARRAKRCPECAAKALKNRPTYERTPERNAAMSRRTKGQSKPWIQGSQHHNFKGGTSPERQRLYVSGEGKAFLRAVYERDGYSCCRCSSGKKGPRSLHAHHLRDWAGNPGLRFDMGNVITLCRDCHQWVHSNENAGREYLT